MCLTFSQVQHSLFRPPARAGYPAAFRAQFQGYSEIGDLTVTVQGEGRFLQNKVLKKFGPNRVVQHVGRACGGDAADRLELQPQSCRQVLDKSGVVTQRTGGLKVRMSWLILEHEFWGSFMTVALDHMILPVSDVEKSVHFYYKTLGLKYEPVALMRVSPTLVLQLIQQPPQISQHLAFSMSKAEFDETFRRLKAAEVPYGDNFDTVGTMTGPGVSHGSSKNASSVYFRDPDGHMLEIMHYEAS
jgi:catechol 2,3-dioxygenase-like lactoylglutathione lyase family enzyme